MFECEVLEEAECQQDHKEDLDKAHQQLKQLENELSII